MLQVKNISKYYGNNVIFKDISFNVKKGEVVSIVGPSGSGKSTLLKCLNRLENYDSGKILLNNTDIKDLKITELRQKIGLVFQEYNLFEHLTVLENLTIGLIKILHFPKEEAEQKAITMLRKVGLDEKIYNYPDELSGGQQQRVAIIRTVLMKPQIILLDEPTSALDKEMKKEVLKLIDEMVKDDMTLIIVSHEEEFVKKISDRIFQMKNHTLKEIRYGRTKTIQR